MIKDPENYDNIKINVHTKNGLTYLNRDVPTQVVSKQELVISFWDGDNLMQYPVSQIDYWEFIFEK